MGTIMNTGEAWTGAGEARGLGTGIGSSPTPAVRGVSRGETAWSGATDDGRLAPFLGWFSIGLGMMELVSPAGTAKFIGVRPSDRTKAVIQAMGAREIAAGVGILTNPKSKEWVGSRVGGDALDLALLGLALTQSEKPRRTLLATAIVIGAAALDTYATESLSQSRKARTPETMDKPGTEVRKSVTIGKSIGEVYSFWRDFTNLPRFMRHLESVERLSETRSRWRARGPGDLKAEWEAEIVEDVPNERISWHSVDGAEIYNAGTVHFREAPAGRGTIVTVEMRYAPPGGKIGAAMLKLLRKEPGQQVGDDLRRFKQVMETGEVVLADATAVPQIHPGQPSEHAAVH